MDDGIGNIVVKVLIAIVGVTTLALILSPSAQTSNVLNSAASGFSGILKTAISPVTGGSSGLSSVVSNLGGLTNGLGSLGLSGLNPGGFGG